MTPAKSFKTGFTLIEVLLATLLATLLLLIAFVVFRAVGRTIGEIQLIAAENRQLRAGYLAVTDDADYWHSHANPELPYLKGHNALSENANSAFDVRPFRRVDWPKDLNAPENPNWPQPHDPRSWYRGHLLPNVPTGTYIWAKSGDPKIGTGYQFSPDFAVESTYRERVRSWPISHHHVQLAIDNAMKGADSEARRKALAKIEFDSGDRLARNIAHPPGWESWHVIGDYAAIQNILQDGALGSDDHRRGSRPRLQWHLAKQLGARGLVAYAHPGAPSLIQAPSENEKTANYTDQARRIDTHHSKGEIPWSLNFSPKLVTARTMDIRAAGGPPAPSDLASYPASFAIEHPDHNRGNYAVVVPSRLDGARNDAMATPTMGLLTDFQVPTGDCPARPMQDLSGELSSRELLPMGMVYAANPLRRTLFGDDFDWYEYHFDNQRPITVLDVRGSRFQDVVATELGPARILPESTYWRELQSRHRRQTWRVPDNYTDDPDPDLDDAATVRAKLNTSILRYLHNGNDRAHCQVVLRDERADRTTTLHLRTISTTFRGARQHWGRRSDEIAITGPDGARLRLGDHYGP